MKKTIKLFVGVLFVLALTGAMAVTAFAAEDDTTGSALTTTDAAVNTTDAAVITTDAAVNATDAAVNATDAAVNTTDAAVNTTGSAVDAEKEVLAPATAKSTKSVVMINGAEVTFEAYNINDNNYFKLRDVAMALTNANAGKQFDVTWDNTTKAINLISNQNYTPVGGELVAGDGTDKNAVPSTATIYMDGTVVELAAYTINNNNFFKLRDLGKSFNFDVTWDGASNAVVVDTTADYTED